MFLVPLGGDSEIEKHVYPDRIEHSTVHEFWSIGTLVVFGTLVGESYLTKMTVSLGLGAVVSLAFVAYGVALGVTYVVRSRVGRRPREITRMREPSTNDCRGLPRH